MIVAVPSIVAIVAIVAAIEAIAVAVGTVDARLIADVPTAAVVRDVIAIARERTERPLPPRRWLG